MARRWCRGLKQLIAHKYEVYLQCSQRAETVKNRCPRSGLCLMLGWKSECTLWFQWRATLTICYVLGWISPTIQRRKVGDSDTLTGLQPAESHVYLQPCPATNVGQCWTWHRSGSCHAFCFYQSEEHSDRVCYRSLSEISPSRIISRYLVYHILLATLAIS